MGTTSHHPSLVHLLKQAAWHLAAGERSRAIHYLLEAGKEVRYLGEDLVLGRPAADDRGDEDARG